MGVGITFLPTQMTRSTLRQILNKTSLASSTRTLKHHASTVQAPQHRRLASSTMAKEFPPQKVRDVVAEVAKLLKEKKETVSVAETAAGGIISASILSTPGASGIYKGGLTVRLRPTIDCHRNTSLLNS